MIEVEQNSNERIYNILFEQDEITWKSMIYDLVSSENMDPWNIDVSLLANKFLEKLKKYKEMDLKVSGKVLLAAAILLRVKSNRFLEEDINALDALIASANADDAEEELFEEPFEFEEEEEFDPEKKPKIYPKTPQPRKRKVSVFDLVNALSKALDVFKRRPKKSKEQETNVKPPEKPRDITLVIRDVYHRVAKLHDVKKEERPKINFRQLLEEDSREEKVFTFMPLLHLDNQRKVELWQKAHLHDIEVELLKHPHEE